MKLVQDMIKNFNKQIILVYKLNMIIISQHYTLIKYSRSTGNQFQLLPQFMLSIGIKTDIQIDYETLYILQVNQFIKGQLYKSSVAIFGMKNYKEEAHKLQTKYLQDESFQKEVDERFKRYQILLQQSLYSDLSSISEDLFVCYNRGDHPIYIYFGVLQNSHKDNMHKLALYFIKFFNRKPSEDYTFVFLNTGAGSDVYGLFKQIFLQLTIDHFLHLRQFILVRPTYYQRAQDYWSFSVFPNYLRNLTIHFYNCAELCTHLNMKPQDFVDIVPAQISKIQFPTLKARKISLENQRINFQGQLLDEVEIAKRKQFEHVMKSFLIVKPGQQTHNLHNYEMNKIGIPIVLQLLIYYFKTHPEGLKEQGLFRKSVSIDEQNETLGELSNKNYDFLLTITNPHIIANLIKRFFSNLKVPVFPFPQFQLIMHDQGIKDKKQHIKDVVASLPKLNYLSLMFLLQFLRDDVISNVQYNKMTAQNISICFAPCLLRAEKASAADLIYASKCAIATRILIDQFQFIFGDPTARQKMFRISQDNVSKQFEKEIQVNIKAQKSQRSSNSVQAFQNIENNRKMLSPQKETIKVPKIGNEQATRLTFNPSNDRTNSNDLIEVLYAPQINHHHVQAYSQSHASHLPHQVSSNRNTAQVLTTSHYRIMNSKQPTISNQGIIRASTPNQVIFTYNAKEQILEKGNNQVNPVMINQIYSPSSLP